MAIHTITAEIVEKRVYAYLVVTNFGWYDDGEDPYDLVPHSSGKKHVMIYKFLKSELPRFENELKEYFAAHRKYIKWSSAAQAISEYIEGSIFPWELIEDLFRWFNVSAKRIYSKSHEYNEEVRIPV